MSFEALIHVEANSTVCYSQPIVFGSRCTSLVLQTDFEYNQISCGATSEERAIGSYYDSSTKSNNFIKNGNLQSAKDTYLKGHVNGLQTRTCIFTRQRGTRGSGQAC